MQLRLPLNGCSLEFLNPLGAAIVLRKKTPLKWPCKKSKFTKLCIFSVRCIHPCHPLQTWLQHLTHSGSAPCDAWVTELETSCSSQGKHHWHTVFPSLCMTWGWQEEVLFTLPIIWHDVLTLGHWVTIWEVWRGLIFSMPSFHVLCGGHLPHSVQCPVLDMDPLESSCCPAAASSLWHCKLLEHAGHRRIFAHWDF